MGELPYMAKKKTWQVWLNHVSWKREIILDNLSGPKGFQMFKLDLEMAEEPEVKLPAYTGSRKKQESSRKTPTSALMTMPDLWLCGSLQTVENS